MTPKERARVLAMEVRAATTLDDAAEAIEQHMAGPGTGEASDEAVVREIAKAMCEVWGWGWGQIAEPRQRMFLEDARAALAVARRHLAARPGDVVPGLVVALGIAQGRHASFGERLLGVMDSGLSGRFYEAAEIAALIKARITEARAPPTTEGTP